MGVVMPLSRKHLEMFTRMSAPSFRTTIRTDTVSTTLEQDTDVDCDNLEDAGEFQLSPWIIPHNKPSLLPLESIGDSLCPASYESFSPHVLGEASVYAGSNHSRPRGNQVRAYREKSGFSDGNLARRFSLRWRRVIAIAETKVLLPRFRL